MPHAYIFPHFLVLTEVVELYVFTDSPYSASGTVVFALHFPTSQATAQKTFDIGKSYEAPIKQ